MSDPLDDAINGLEGEITGKIAPWQNVLDKAASFAKEVGAFPEGFAKGYTLGGTELAKGLANKITGTTPEDEQQIQQMLGGESSGLGEGIGTGVGAFGELALDIPKGIKSIADLMATGKIQKIQKAFFPWVKQHSDEYGKIIKEGIKKMAQSGKLGVTKKEAEAIFDPILSASPDVQKQLPKKAIEVAERVRTRKGSMGIKDLMKEQARLKRSITSAERAGKTVTERSRLIKDTTKNISDFTKRNIPELAAKNPEYAKYAQSREFMQKAFTPDLAHTGELGTKAGTETIKNIKKLEPAEEAAIRLFEKDTGLSIVDPARRMATVRSIGSGIKKSIPYLGAGGIGAGIATVLGKNRYQGPSNYPT